MTKEEKAKMRAEKRKLRKEKGIGFFQEFKKFIMRGNVLDMAVGVIVASAFTKIVTTLNTKIIMPWVTWLIGDYAVEDIKTVLRPAVVDEAGVVVTSEIAVMWGELLQSILDFLLIAIIIFLTIKIINTVRTKIDAAALKAKMLLFKKAAEEEVPVEEVVEEVAPLKPTTEELLTEIRDLLKQKSE